MLKISTKDLTQQQVNEIIVLVRKNRGRAYSSTKKHRLEIDLSLLKRAERGQVKKEIKKIKKEKAST